MRFRVTSKRVPLAFLLLVPWLMSPRFAEAQGKPARSSAAAQVAKAVGTIKSIQPDSITVAVESGDEVTAKLTESTKLLRVPPGEKDLKNAVPLQMQDLQAGDRVLVRGQSSPDAPDTHTITALAVIVMKQVDVAAKKQHDLEEWQKRGVGGIVTKVDAATNTITISSNGVGAVRNIAVHVAKETILRRYAHRLGEVRRRQARTCRPIHGANQGRRSVARAGNTRPRRQRIDGGGSRSRLIPEYCGNHQGH